MVVWHQRVASTARRWFAGDFVGHYHSRMVRPRRHLQWIALVWAFAQAGLPAAFVVTDALATERAGPAAQVSHVEDGPGQGCRPSHPAECAVCRFLSTNHATLAAPR